MPVSSSQSTKPRRTDGAVLYIVGDEGIVFAPTSRCLFRLNTSATFIWRCYQEGMEPPSIANALVERFGIAKDLALRDITQTISEWKANGLLDTPTDDFQQPIDTRSEASGPTLPGPRVEPHSERLYRLLDLQFRIRYPCEETAKLVHRVFAHLENTTSKLDTGASVSFEIVENARGYALLRDARLVADCCVQAELAPMIQHETILAAYQSTECLVAVHAAAVAKDRHCILMPAAKGSGKTTLTAGLLASDYTYLTDECSLLMPESSQIRPMPVSLGLKRGSWPILRPSYPILKNLPTHVQAGEVHVRFLNPPRNLITTQESHSVTHIVFPKYSAAKPTQLMPLGHAEALWRIAEGGYAVPGQLDKTRVEGLIAWVIRLPCYELIIGTLDDAVHELEKMLE